MAQSGGMLAAALELAAKGWPVFPCSPENKQPLVPGETSKGAKDGGLYLATCDVAQITKWWTRWPKAMIGVPQGEKTGAFVLDLDPKLYAADAMLKAIAAWVGEGALPACPVSRTQSGGLHLFFKLPLEKIGNRAGLFQKIEDAPLEIKAHVDVRAGGGYVIVPPSVMASGNAYRWEQEPDGECFPDAPQKLIDAVLKKLDAKPEQRPQTLSQRASGGVAVAPSGSEAVDKTRHRYAMAALDREIAELARCGEGQRGFKLNKVAFSLGGLVGAGILSESLARRELWTACERNGLLAKDGGQLVDSNIARCLSDGMSKPIDISQIGARAGTSFQSRKGAALRPPDQELPSDFSSSSPPPSDGDQDGPASQSGGSNLGRLYAGGVEIDVRCSLLPLTDLGNAQRFVARYGSDFKHVDQWGWLAWDGRRWNGDEAEAILNRAVHDTIKAIAEEAHQLRLLQKLWQDDIDSMADDTRQLINPVIEVKKTGVVIFAADRLSGWCLASQSNSHISCVARLAQAYLTASSDDFDNDPMALNVANGTLRFKKHESDDYVSFHAHERSDLMTKISETVYDPTAGCPIYDHFFERVQPDAAMRVHLHSWGGVSLTGQMLAKLHFWHGTGRNGKSTLVDAWANVMGEYSQTIPIESFLDQGRSRRGGEASPDIASLPGIRFLRTSEPERGSKLAEGLVKLVTGGEPMRARHLNKDFFEFLPRFKLNMQGNYKPRIDGTDEGMWARILFVPWKVMIPAEERDVELPKRLKGEASGILNRLLDGLRFYLDKGLMPPDEVLAATAEYREDSDPIGRFLTDCTARTPDDRGARVAANELFKLYVAWAKGNGERAASPKGFSKGLQDHGITRLKSSGNWYLGLDMTKQADDFKGMEFEDEPPKKY
jgi:putative DNA primase/helicase